MVELEKKDGAEAVKVIVRCRPMNKREKDLNCTKCVELEYNAGRVVITKPDEGPDSGKTFTFDGAFDTDSTQVDLYQVAGQPLVESVMDGYNGTIFAYGQTGCGKSFSMMGVPTDPELMGIIPRAFQQIFDTIASNDNPDKKFLVQACYIEIYNEEVRDLLSSNHTARLDLKEHPEKGVYIQGVTYFTVSSVDEITKLMEQGTANRSVGATLMNADSSRSHSIFIVQVETSQPSEAGEILRQGVLNLVDLAGSERQGKTGATGQRLKEAAKINLSLSALGNVISALVAGKTHIPYRDSKLTRLLQNSLGGNAKTVMLAAISPAHDNYEETLSTLRYANRAKSIKNKPKVNEDPRDAMLREYQEEIQRLRALLSQSGIEVASSGGNGAAMEGEKVKMIKQAKDEMLKLNEETKQGEEETKYMQQQLQMETAEQQARLQALEAQRKEVEAMREEILKKEQELAQREQGGSVGVDHEAAKRQLAEERAMLEEEIMRERDTQLALELALKEKEEESERMRAQLEKEQEDREKRQKELQEKLSTLEKENNAARRELERKLAMMENKLMLGGAKAQEDKDAALNRLNKMKREREKSEMARKELEMEAKRLHGQLMQGQQQQSQQNEEIQWLREQVAMLNSEMDDLRDEFATEKADYVKTVKELSKELMLYKGIVRSTMEPESLRNIIAAARYDERSGKWLMANSGYGNSGGMGMSMRPHMPAPPSGPSSGANNIRSRMYQRSVSGSGPGATLGFGKTSGIADTESLSPQPADQRADNGWKKSIRGEFAAMPPPGPGISRTKTGRSPVPEVDVNDIVNLPRRPGFKPNMEPETSLSGSKPVSRGESRQELTLDQMRPRPGFVPAGPPAPSPRTPMAKDDVASDLLSMMPRRPGFQPAGPL